MEKRGLSVTKNLIKVTISVLKSKSAAKHFEMHVAAHLSTGSDMGEIGHGRKQFNEILKAIEAYLDSEVENYLFDAFKEHTTATTFLWSG